MASDLVAYMELVGRVDVHMVQVQIADIEYYFVILFSSSEVLQSPNMDYSHFIWYCDINRYSSCLTLAKL